MISLPDFVDKLLRTMTVRKRQESRRRQSVLTRYYRKCWMYVARFVATMTNVQLGHTLEEKHELLIDHWYMNWWSTKRIWISPSLGAVTCVIWLLLVLSPAADATDRICRQLEQLDPIIFPSSSTIDFVVGHLPRIFPSSSEEWEDDVLLSNSYKLAFDCLLRIPSPETSGWITELMTILVRLSDNFSGSSTCEKVQCMLTGCGSTWTLKAGELERIRTIRANKLACVFVDWLRISRCWLHFASFYLINILTLQGSLEIR